MNQDQIQELINSSKQGDAKAFGILIKEFQSLVFRLAFRLLCDEDEAKDIVQETFVKIWLGLNKYDPRFKFSTWIYKIASNLCYDRLRSISNSPQRADCSVSGSGLNFSSQEDVESVIINKELKELILFFTRYLSTKQKLVFTLIDIEELEVDEVERITGLSAAKIKSNLYLARKYIKNRINALTT